MRDYRLSPEQQNAWQARVDRPDLPRGRKSQIADELVKSSKGTKASWKTTLGRFFQGDATALQSIFENPRRLAVVARCLTLTPEQLREHLDQVRGQGKEDGPFDVRIPGFEDYGPVPVLEALFTANLQFESFLPANGPSAGGGPLELEHLLKAARPQTPQVACAVVVVGEPGTGKSTLLRAIAAQLQREGIRVAPWEQGISVEGGVVYRDDFDLLEPALRVRLCEVVNSGRCTLLTTAAPEDALTDLPQFRAVYTIQPGYAQWALNYLSHVERLVARRFGRQVSFAVLRDWIEDDPFAGQLTRRIDNLGLLARHTLDHDRPPAGLHELAPLALRRCVAHMRGRGSVEDAALIDSCGEGTLRRLAVKACRLGRSEVAAGDLVPALAAAIDHAVPRPTRRPEPRPTEALFPCAERLLEAGLLYRRGRNIYPRQMAYFVSALGAHMGGQPESDGELLRACVLFPMWRDAPAAAAEHCGEGTEVLAGLLRLSPEVLCQAVPTLTRLLATKVHFRDRSAYERAFRLCLSYWARWPADPRAKTMKLGLAPGPAAQPTWSDGLVSDVLPLLVLALASHRHCSLLPERITPEEVQGGQDLSEPVYAYLALYGRAQISLDQARDAVTVGAPFQTDLLLNRTLWESLPPLREEPAGVGGLKTDDYQMWWRLAAAPRLQREVEWMALLSGTHAGTTILSGMTQGPRGTRIWRDALRDRLRTRDDAALAAYVAALRFTLHRGGQANEAALQEVWDATPARPRLRDAVTAALGEGLDAGSIHCAPEFLSWLLSTVVGEEIRSNLFSQWIPKAPGLWRSFLAAGLAQVQIASWALAARAEEAASSALVELAKSDDPEVLMLVIQSMHETAARAALARLCQMASPAARALRLRLAADPTRMPLHELVNGMVPEDGEEALWLSIAEHSTSLADCLLGHVAAALVSTSPAPWDRTLGLLKFLDALLIPEHEAAISQALAVLGRSADEEGARHSVARQRRSLQFGDFFALLHPLVAAVQIASVRGKPEVAPLLTGLFSLPYLRRTLAGERQAPLWRAAFAVLGRDGILRVVEEDHGHMDRLAAGRLHAFLGIGEDAFVRELLAHPQLGPSAATALVATAHGAGEILDLLEEQALLTQAEPPRPHAVAWSLFQAIHRLDAEAALEWLAGRLRGEAREVQTAWWSQVVPLTEVGPLRARATSLYLETRRLGPARRTRGAHRQSDAALSPEQAASRPAPK